MPLIASYFFPTSTRCDHHSQDQQVILFLHDDYGRIIRTCREAHFMELENTKKTVLQKASQEVERYMEQLQREYTMKNRQLEEKFGDWMTAKNLQDSTCQTDPFVSADEDHSITSLLTSPFRL